MANVQQGFGNSPADAYFSIPPITRYFATACVTTTALTSFKLISPYLLYLSWSHIFKLQVGNRDSNTSRPAIAPPETYVQRVCSQQL